MAHFKIDATWIGKDGVRHVENEIGAADACEALDFALPGSWRTGAFDECTVRIQPLPHNKDSQDQEVR